MLVTASMHENRFGSRLSSPGPVRRNIDRDFASVVFVFLLVMLPVEPAGSRSAMPGEPLGAGSVEGLLTSEEDASWLDGIRGSRRRTGGPGFGSSISSVVVVVVRIPESKPDGEKVPIRWTSRRVGGAARRGSTVVLKLMASMSWRTSVPW